MWALPRAAIGPVDPGGTDRDGTVGQRARQLVAAAAVSYAVREHGVDVEPEAERNHPATVAPPARREQDGVPVRYASGEEGGVSATDGSR